jgi:hypothetical protein
MMKRAMRAIIAAQDPRRIARLAQILRRRKGMSPQDDNAFFGVLFSAEQADA